MDKISFFNFSVEAHHTNLTLADVSEEEVFDITEMREFRIKLNNWSGMVIDFQNYVQNRVNSVRKKDFQILKVP